MRLKGASMDNLAANMRQRVIETLSLVSSEDRQRKYQLAVPYIDVSAELFNQWEDFYHPDDDGFRQGFRPEELEALRRFNNVFEEVAKETPKFLPPLDEFLKSTSWRKLSDAAAEALRALSRNAGRRSTD